jgi:diguanylate cyclase (GGDEF)-like protein
MVTTDLPGDRPRRILLIEDSELDRFWLRSRLTCDRLIVQEAPDGISGLAACRDDPPDLILLDLGLPLCGGFEILSLLKEDARVGSVPVIVVSATDDSTEKARGLDLGAVDYVTKPYDLIELQARIRAALRTKRLQELLEQRAHVDGLTGLANRLAMEERLATEWGMHQRHGGSLAIWVADLDHFKRVNDTYGHATGDEVLRQAASVLKSSVRTTDLAARFGGEEFVVIAPYCGLAGALKTSERFRSRLAAVTITPDRGQAFRVTVSVGVAAVPEDLASSPAELLSKADLALYQAKSQGRNRVLSPTLRHCEPVEPERQAGWVLARA